MLYAKGVTGTAVALGDDLACIHDRSAHNVGHLHIEPVLMQRLLRMLKTTTQRQRDAHGNLRLLVGRLRLADEYRQIRSLSALNTFTRHHTFLQNQGA
jgi:hypothetical protein